MDKICENCRFWKMMPGSDVKRCKKIIIDSRGRQADNPVKASTHYVPDVFLATFPLFGCILWEEAKEKGPFFLTDTTINFTLPNSEVLREDGWGDLGKLVSWLNELWEKHEKPDITEIITVGVFRTFDKRGLEYQPYIRFGDVQLDLGLRWFTEEGAIKWLNSLKEKVKCQL